MTIERSHLILSMARRARTPTECFEVATACLEIVQESNEDAMDVLEEAMKIAKAKRAAYTDRSILPFRKKA